jgi:hypothetical protein
MIRLSLLLWLAIASQCIGANAVINGPTTAIPGDLVVLNATESEGAAFRWIMPQGIQTLACSDLEIGFASGRPGIYSFTLIAADTAEGVTQPIDYVTHTVTIGTPSTPDPGQPPAPEQPGPPLPPIKYEQVRTIARDAAKPLNDVTTAKGLSTTIATKCNEFAAACEQMRCPTLPSAKAAMVAAIENRLLARTGSSRAAAWDTWRRAVNDAINATPTITIQEYIAIMRAVSQGLAES